MALGRAEDAVVWLETAYQGAMGNREIAASYAHALARAGNLPLAKRVLSRAMRKGVSREQAALWKWLEAGAPPEQDAASCAARIPFQARPAMELTNTTRRRRSRKRSDETAAELEAALARGLENLPLDARQRARPRALRDPAVRRMADEGHSVQTLAAALAYAIVYVDHVPLTQAEVAASFRVSGASLRGRFGAAQRAPLGPGRRAVPPPLRACPDRDPGHAQEFRRKFHPPRQALAIRRPLSSATRRRDATPRGSSERTQAPARAVQQRSTGGFRPRRKTNL